MRTSIAGSLEEILTTEQLFLSESTIRKDSSRRFVLWKTSERSVEPPRADTFERETTEQLFVPRGLARAQNFQVCPLVETRVEHFDPSRRDRLVASWTNTQVYSVVDERESRERCSPVG